MIGRYVFGAVVFYITINVILLVANAYRTTMHREYFKEAHTKMKETGKLYNFHVIDMEKTGQTAKVLFIETFTTDEKSFQVGKLVSFKFDDKKEIWEFVNQKIIWDGRNKKGNDFTFPPYYGGDWMVLLKR